MDARRKRAKKKPRIDVPALFGGSEARTLWLFTLVLNEPITATELARVIGVTQKAAVLITNFFVEIGVVEKQRTMSKGPHGTRLYCPIRLNVAHPAYRELREYCLAAANEVGLERKEVFRDPSWRPKGVKVETELFERLFGSAMTSRSVIVTELAHGIQSRKLSKISGKPSDNHIWQMIKKPTSPVQSIFQRAFPGGKTGWELSKHIPARRLFRKLILKLSKIEPSLQALAAASRLIKVNVKVIP